MLGGGNAYAAAAGPTAYNQPVVHTIFSSRVDRVTRVATGVAISLSLAFFLLAFGSVSAQAQAAGNGSAATGAAAAGKGRILLVLPFDNRSGQPSLEWIREAGPEILTSRFATAAMRPFAARTRQPVRAGHGGREQTWPLNMAVKHICEFTYGCHRLQLPRTSPP
jgi:hypothetical protein